MFRVVAALSIALVALSGCKKDDSAPPSSGSEPQQNEPELFVDRTPDGGMPESAEDDHSADELGEVAAPSIKVTEELILKYLAYRKVVVERGRDAVARVQKDAAEAKKDGEGGSQNLTRRAEAFAVTMRAIEEKAREENGLSRDEVVAVGQVVGEVFAARQIWKLNGGDEALQQARAKLATMDAAQKSKAEQALARNEKSFAAMRDAASARKRFGDAAVDAVLKHEDDLWKVQQEGAKVMAAVY